MLEWICILYFMEIIPNFYTTEFLIFHFIKINIVFENSILIGCNFYYLLWCN
jgi:hypothetical protein